MLQAQSRSPRVANDPDKYIRVCNNGQYQARPYLDGERYNLGLFATRHSARAAIAKFWWGKLKDIPKYTYGIQSAAGVRFFAIIRFQKTPHKLGPFETRSEAAAAVMGIVLGIVGPDLLEDVLKRGNDAALVSS